MTDDVIVLNSLTTWRVVKRVSGVYYLSVGIHYRSFAILPESLFAPNPLCLFCGDSLVRLFAAVSEALLFGLLFWAEQAKEVKKNARITGIGNFRLIDKCL